MDDDERRIEEAVQRLIERFVAEARRERAAEHQARSTGKDVPLAGAGGGASSRPFAQLAGNATGARNTKPSRDV